MIQRQSSVSDKYIASMLEKSWLLQGVRKKFRRASWSLWEWGRRTLPYSWKRVLKQLFRRDLSSPAKIPLPSHSVEEALSVWTTDSLLCQALSRVAHPDHHVPRASIVVLTHDHLPVTRLCLESIYLHTEYPHFELIVIDNGSQDGTRAYLEGLKRIVPNLQVIFNSRNEGFARATNQGLLLSCSDYAGLLNNDTIVCPGWLSGLIHCLEKNKRVGMVGPVTSSAGNEQMIDVNYTGLEELENFAKRRLREQEGHFFEVDMLGMFCLVFRKRLMDEVGLLDERFEQGTFEDDDYCHRVRIKGYKLLCAEDIFVHHFGKATMAALGDRGYLKLFEGNRRRFQSKWGVHWHPPMIGHRLGVQG